MQVSQRYSECLHKSFPGLKEAIVDSIEPAKVLLESMFQKLGLKDQPFQVFHSASSSQLDSFWNVILQVESSLSQSDMRATVLKDRLALKAFLEHCCLERHYMFCIKKCGEPACKFALFHGYLLTSLGNFTFFLTLFLMLVKNTFFHCQKCMEQGQVKSIVHCFKNIQLLVLMEFLSIQQANMHPTPVKL